MFTFLYQDSDVAHKIDYINPTPETLHKIIHGDTTTTEIDSSTTNWARVFQTIQRHVELRFLCLYRTTNYHGRIWMNEFSFVTEDCQEYGFYEQNYQDQIEVHPNDLDGNGDIRPHSKLDVLVTQIKQKRTPPKPLLIQYLFQQFHVKVVKPTQTNRSNDNKVSGETINNSVKEYTDILFSPMWESLEKDYVKKTFDVIVMNQIHQDIQTSLNEKIKQCEDFSKKHKELENQVMNRNQALSSSCTELFQMREQIKTKENTCMKLDRRLIDSSLKIENQTLHIKELESNIDSLKKEMEENEKKLHDQLMEREQCILSLTDEIVHVTSKKEETIKQQSERCAELLLENKSFSEELTKLIKDKEKLSKKIQDLENQIQMIHRERVSVIINNHKTLKE